MGAGCDQWTYWEEGAADGLAAQQSTLQDDLRQQVGEQNLAGLVEEAVRQVSRAETTQDHTPMWDLLLRLITYFYASGVYRSDEIEESLYRNTGLAAVRVAAFGHAQPSEVLRSFRRTNRNTIELCLAAVLRSASARRQAECDRFCVSPGPGDVRKEAACRVRRAMEYDSWALDV